MLRFLIDLNIQVVHFLLKAEIGSKQTIITQLQVRKVKEMFQYGRYRSILSFWIVDVYLFKFHSLRVMSLFYYKLVNRNP